MFAVGSPADELQITAGASRKDARSHGSRLPPPKAARILPATADAARRRALRAELAGCGDGRRPRCSVGRRRGLTAAADARHPIPASPGRNRRCAQRKRGTFQIGRGIERRTKAGASRPPARKAYCAWPWFSAPPRKSRPPSAGRNGKYRRPALGRVVQVNQEISAGDQIAARKRRVLENIVRGEEHLLANLFPHPVTAVVLREKLPQPFRRHVRLDHRRIKPVARVGDRLLIHVGARKSARRADSPAGCNVRKAASRSSRLPRPSRSPPPRRGPRRPSFCPAKSCGTCASSAANASRSRKKWVTPMSRSWRSARLRRMRADEIEILRESTRSSSPACRRAMRRRIVARL